MASGPASAEMFFEPLANLLEIQHRAKIFRQLIIEPEFRHIDALSGPATAIALFVVPKSIPTHFCIGRAFGIRNIEGQ